MSFLVLIVLCLVQGLTEFLPVSSSGHLLLFSQLFGINDNNLLLNLFLHIATLVAVIIVYRKVILKILKKPFQPLTFKLLLSTSITLIFAFAYEILNIDNHVTKIYGFCFLITSILLFVTHKFQKRASVVNLNQNISYKSATLVGFIQGLAVLPGLSRSGSTICSLILAGNNEEKSAEYSFLLSIPIIIGGFIFELIKIDNFGEIFASVSPLKIIFAFVFTFAVAIISLKLTLKLLKKNKFIFFSIYLFFVSIFVIIFNIFI